jgi:hypothetical protein
LQISTISAPPSNAAFFAELKIWVPPRHLSEASGLGLARNNLARRELTPRSELFFVLAGIYSR